MSKLRWLHFSDLHEGLERRSKLWPSARERLVEDLKSLHDRTGPWDVVFFTGDLTQSGASYEFDRLTSTLNELWFRMNQLGSRPILLAVPGNHDLLRLSDPARSAELIALRSGWNDPELQEVFWEDSQSSYRRLVDTVFSNYGKWWLENPLRPEPMNFGLLPGDFSMTLKVGDMAVGVVGLNSAFLQLSAGDYQGRLALAVEQFHGACGGDGNAWAGQHNLWFFLTHHPPIWLNQNAAKAFRGEISSAGRLAFHLFGHMHKGDSEVAGARGEKPVAQIQCCSLFGRESAVYGECRHGYNAGCLEFDGYRAGFRLWPRTVSRRSNGAWSIVADTRFELDSNDQGTYPREVSYSPTVPICPEPEPSLARITDSQPAGAIDAEATSWAPSGGGALASSPQKRSSVSPSSSSSTPGSSDDRDRTCERPDSNVRPIASWIPLMRKIQPFRRPKAVLLCLGGGVAVIILLVLFWGDDEASPMESKTNIVSVSGVSTVQDQSECKLTLMSIGAEGEYDDPKYTKDSIAYGKMADAYNKKNEKVGQMKITIEHVARPHEAVKRRLMDILTSADAPDILVWSAGTNLSQYKQWLFPVAPLFKEDETSTWMQRWLGYGKSKLDNDDDKDYFIPFKTYVWAFYYFESVFRDAGIISKPGDPLLIKDLASLVNIAEALKKKNFTPIAFGNREGWPAIGYFDSLTMRSEDFSYYKNLLSRPSEWRCVWKAEAEERDESCKLFKIFEIWKKLVPYFSSNWHLKSYRDAAKAFLEKKAGMILLGGFFIEALDEKKLTPSEYKEAIKDLRLFPFPAIEDGGTTFGLDAPIDGFVLPKNAGRRRTEQCTTALKKVVVEFLTDVKGFKEYDSYNPASSLSMLKSLADGEGYFKYKYPVQRQAAKLLKKNHDNGSVASFLDRDLSFRYPPDKKRDLVDDVIVPQLRAFLTSAAGITDQSIVSGFHDAF